MSLNEIKKKILEEIVTLRVNPTEYDVAFEHGYCKGLYVAFEFFEVEEKRILKQIREYEEEGRKLENLMGYNCKLSIAEVLRGVIGK